MLMLETTGNSAIGWRLFPGRFDLGLEDCSGAPFSISVLPIANTFAAGGCWLVPTHLGVAAGQLVRTEIKNPIIFRTGVPLPAFSSLPKPSNLRIPPVALPLI
jgi:hypothetical protein